MDIHRKMGITSFTQIAKAFKCATRKEKSELSQKKIVILDASNAMFKYCIGRINNGEPIFNKDGKLVIHLMVTFSIVTKMLSQGLQPLFVFEGTASLDDKNIVCAERKKIKDKSRIKCLEIEDKTSPEYLKHMKRSFQLKSKHYDEIKKLLELAGIPYVTAPGEGDPQCAAISKYYKLPVITDDTDILAYGGTKIWRDFSMANMNTTELSRKTIIENMKIEANKIRFANDLCPINLEYENFVDYCIMLGTDYTPFDCKTKISGSVEKLFEIFVINNFDVRLTCDYIRENDVKLRISNKFIESWERIREKYLETPVIHPKNINIYMTNPHVEELINYLCDEYDLDRFFVTKKLSYFSKHNFFSNEVSSENTSYYNFRQKQYGGKYYISDRYMSYS